MGYEDTFRKIKVKDTVYATTVTSTTSNPTTLNATNATVSDKFVLPVQNVTGTTTAALYQSGLITMTPSGVTGTVTVTLIAPAAAGQMLIIQNRAATGTVLKVDAGTGVTFDGTNQIATFGTNAQQLILMSTSATRWLVLLNSGTVTFGSS